MIPHASFAAGLLAPDASEPAEVCAPGGGRAGTRYNVYRNNVTVSLVEALAEAFPVVKALVGEEFFTAMARAFVPDHPPQEPEMTFYGSAFPDWLAQFPPVARLPYLPEVARIEHARVHACHARDAAPLDPHALQGMAPDALSLLRLAPHPSARIVPTRYPALSIWARNTGEEALRHAGPGDVLICRPHWEVQMRMAPKGVAQTLDALAAGQPLTRAVPTGCEAAAVFACLFSAGALIKMEV